MCKVGGLIIVLGDFNAEKRVIQHLRMEVFQEISRFTITTSTYFDSVIREVFMKACEIWLS